MRSRKTKDGDICVCVHSIECCQKDERINSERQGYDERPQVCVTRHKNESVEMNLSRDGGLRQGQPN